MKVDRQVERNGEARRDKADTQHQVPHFLRFVLRVAKELLSVFPLVPLFVHAKKLVIIVSEHGWITLLRLY